MPVAPSTRTAARNPGRRTWWSRALSDAERYSTPTPPPWAEFLDEALAPAPGKIPGPNGTWGHGPDVPGPEGTLLPPLKPFLTAAGARFAACTGAADTAEAAVVGAGARDCLARCLTKLAARTLVAELATARATGALRGRGPEERFAHFVRGLCARRALVDVLHRHPVLARLLAVRCLGAVDAAAELLAHLAADRAPLADRLLGGVPGPLTAVRFGLGEPHRGGRTVALLDFGGVPRLVHKPRPLGLHARWNELLTEYGAASPRTVRVLPRGAYGWAEYVPARPVLHRAGVRRFYRRLGAQLALLYAMDATDIHGQNVIAHGDQPVVVDVETLFHPCWVPGTDGGGDPALDALADSVHRTSVLPAALFGQHGFLDVSAVGALPGDEVPAELPRWADAGKDTMCLVRDGAARFDGANRPRPRGAATDPVAHAADLRRGFRAGYLALAARADELTRSGGPLDRLAEETLRFVPRPSQTYADLLSEATAPDALRDHAAHTAPFASLGDPTGHREHEVLAPAESADLAAGDVPMFTARVGGRAVLTSAGAVLHGLLRESGLAAARAGLRGLSEADLVRQEWLIGASLATKGPSRYGSSPGLPALTPPRGARGPVAAATWLGDELLRRGVRDRRRVNWLGLARPDGTHWSVLPLGADLADGYPGVAVFLAELARATGRSRYHETAVLAARPLPSLVRLLAATPDLARAVGPGVRDGLGGIVYATVRLARLLDGADIAAAVPDALAAFAIACRAGGAPARPAARAIHAATGLPGAGALVRELAPEGGDPEDGRPRPPGSNCPHRRYGARAAIAPDHSLCHGSAGDLERLAARRDAGERRAAAALGVSGARLLTEIGRGGVRCGTPGRVPVPGLLTGLAGIGHGLLRLARGPDVLPAWPSPWAVEPVLTHHHTTSEETPP